MRSFCVYLTTYRGNLLPPFYIGYCRTSNIAKGYRGSVSSIDYKSIFRREIKANPHLFSTKIIKTFDTLDEALQAEIRLQKAVSAHTNPMYMNRVIGSQLFHLTGHSTKAREKMRRSWTPERIEKHVARCKGRPSSLKGRKLGKRKKHTPEMNRRKSEKLRAAWARPDTRARLQASRHHPTEEERQISSKRVSDTVWINDGSVSRRVKRGTPLAVGWVHGRLTFKRTNKRALP